MAQLAVEVGVILLLTVLNGVFALAETAIVSARRGRLKQWALEGRPGAARALALAEDPTTFLATVQVGITLIGVLAGAFGGVTLGKALQELLIALSVPDAYAQTLAVGAVVAAITCLTVVVGELLPKSLALTLREAAAAFLAGPVTVLSCLAAPAVWLLSAATQGLLRILHIEPPAEPPVTPEEVRILVDEGAEAGVFEADEKEMVEGVLELDDLGVEALMRPRGDVTWLNTEDTVPDMLAKASRGHPQLPLCEGDVDEVVGVVRVQDLLYALTSEGSVDLQAIARAPALVPEGASALDALRLLATATSHTAIVVDAHGGLAGILTMHDIVRRILRGLQPADDAEDVPRIVGRADGSWLVDGRLPFIDFLDGLGIAEPDESAPTFHTVGGLVMASLGKIPKVGDVVQWSGLRIEVVDMDERRVKQVTVAGVEGADEVED